MIDRYLVGAIGAIELVLLPVLATLGTPDAPTFISLLFLAFGLPCTAGFLFISFLKKANGIVQYGCIHSALAGFSILAAVVSVTAVLWHSSMSAALVFLVVSVGMIVGCFSYAEGLLYQKASPELAEGLRSSIKLGAKMGYLVGQK
jgi:hypothetical protein